MQAEVKALKDNIGEKEKELLSIEETSSQQQVQYPSSTSYMA